MLDACVKAVLQGEGDSTNGYMEDDHQAHVFLPLTKQELLKLQGHINSFRHFIKDNDHLSS